LRQDLVLSSYGHLQKMILKTHTHLLLVFIKQSQAWAKRVSFLLVAVLLSVFLSACLSSGTQAPISHRKPPPSTKLSTHTVAPGETLYSIAWRYGLDYRRLAAANQIDENFEIFPGQRITLRENYVAIPNSPTQSSLVVVEQNRQVTKRARKPGSDKPSPNTQPSSRQSTNASNDRFYDKDQKINWQWPAKGPVIAKFSTRQNSQKGIDIAGNRGDTVFAAAPGKVVYAGSGLRGYGKLVIIKHSKIYLSAYAHNNRLHVKENDIVKVGQRIADVGSTGIGTNGEPKLHFQIRRNGKPVNPVSLLPKKKLG
jgi:lipoprotein NlpD